MKTWIKLLSVVSIVALGGFLTYRFLTVKKVTAPVVTSEQLVIAKLESDKASDQEVIQSLQRLTLSAHPDGRRLAEKYLNHPSPEVVSAAVEGLGSYSRDGIPEIIMTALASPVPRFRMAAVRGLSRRAEPGNEQVLVKFCERNDLSVAEKLEANFSLTKITDSLSRRKKYVRETIKLLSAEKMPNHAHIIQALALAGSEPELVKLAKIWVKDSLNESVRQVASQYLAKYEN